MDCPTNAELLELAKRHPAPQEWYDEEWPQYAETVKHIRQALAAGVPLRDIEGALDQEENHG